MAAFLVSPFGAAERTWKPFNPVLGETFEADKLQNDAFFVAEQVRPCTPWDAVGPYLCWVRECGLSAGQRVLVLVGVRYPCSVLTCCLGRAMRLRSSCAGEPPPTSQRSPCREQQLDLRHRVSTHHQVPGQQPGGVPQG